MREPLIVSLLTYIKHAIPATECPVWREVAPQGAANPCAVLREASGVFDQTELCDTGGRETEWQLDVYADDAPTAELLMQRFVRRLNVPGQVLQWACGEILYLRVTGVRDMTELEQEDGSAERVVRRMIEFEIITQKGC